MTVDPINIISNSYSNVKIGGPKKVVANLVRGLEEINCPYVINRALGTYRRNYIHDSVMALIEADVKNIPVIAGPNIAVLPKDLPALSFRNVKNIYLQPSQWVIDLWKQIDPLPFIFRAWPVGVDTERFKPSAGKVTDSVMIYFKKRDPELLRKVEKVVRDQGLIPLTVSYGSYDEPEYLDTIARCKFGIWIGISESQGIALQEALSCNLPLIVCDVSTLFESLETKEYLFPKSLADFKPTSAPYFDNSCGIVIHDIDKELNAAIQELSSGISQYKPREYILSNLSLKKQAAEMVGFFEMLEKENESYYKGRIFNAKNVSDFQPSGGAKAKYLFFLLKRKLRTAFRLLRVRFVK